MRILITGGTGLIGRAFAAEALKDQHELIILTRSPNSYQTTKDITYVGWDGETGRGWCHLLEGTDVVINLAGENIGERLWTPARKVKIRESRLKAGEAVLKAFQMVSQKPKVLVQVSAIGFYGDTGDQEVDETSPAAMDYLGRLCVDWENSTLGVEDLGVRRVILRTGLVFTKKGGALEKLVLPYKLFACGSLGNGLQWWPWIHHLDQALAMLYLIRNENAHGVFNLCVPQPARMKEVGKELAKVLGRPYWLPIPAFAVKILLGEMSGVVLDGQRVIPKRLMDLGYSFEFTDLRKAMIDLFTP